MFGVAKPGVVEKKKNAPAFPAKGKARKERKRNISVPEPGL